MKIEEPPTPYHHYDSGTAKSQSFGVPCDCSDMLCMYFMVDADTGSTHSPATPQSPFKAGAAPTMADVSPEKVLAASLDVLIHICRFNSSKLVVAITGRSYTKLCGEGPIKSVVRTLKMPR